MKIAKHHLYIYKGKSVYNVFQGTKRNAAETHNKTTKLAKFFGKMPAKNVKSRQMQKKIKIGI